MTNAESTTKEVDLAEENLQAAASEIDTTASGTIAKLPPAGGTSASQTTELWQQYWNLFVQYLSKLPDYLGDFFSTNQRPLTIVALIVSAAITVYVTGAVVDAINDIPLLAPFFELVGIGYSAWFVYRYLRLASTRQELSQKVQDLKQEVVGMGGSK